MTEILGTASVSDYHRTALLRGAASAFDLRGNTLRQYRLFGSSTGADRYAMSGDMKVVLDDVEVVTQA